MKGIDNLSIILDPTTGKALYDDSKRDVILPMKSNTIRDFE